jgi:SAM-dependent methyltransferase
MKNSELLINYHFKPGVIGVLINPFYIARSNLYKSIFKYRLLFSGKLLDIGCGDKPYESLFSNVSSYEGLEIDTTVHLTTKADYFYDGKKLPFENNSYDSILLNEVIEHVFNPEQLLTEIHRILRNDGKMLITLPFCWDEHEQPYDYARYSSFGIKYLLEKNGFKIISLDKSCPNFGVILQLVNTYIYKVTRRYVFIVRVIIRVFLCFPLNVFGLALGWLLPKNYDLYLDNIIVVSKA